MKLGICTWAFARSAAGRREVTELTEIAAAAGFHSLEAAFSPRGSVSLQHAPPERTTIPIASLATLDLHRFSVASGIQRRREAAEQTISELLRCAAAWGIPSVSISPGSKSPGFVFEDEFDRICEALSPHVIAAQELGVQLALENVPGHLLESRAGMAAMLTAFPTLGLCLDIGNTLADPPFHHWLEAFADRVTKIHISDAGTAGGWSAADLGNGQVDWLEVRSCLTGLRIAESFVETPWDGKTEESCFVRHLAERTATLLGIA